MICCSSHLDCAKNCALRFVDDRSRFNTLIGCGGARGLRSTDLSDHCTPAKAELIRTLGIIVEELIIVLHRIVLASRA